MQDLSDGFNTKTLLFQQVKATVIMVGKSDLDLSGVQPLFKPFMFEFDCVVPKNLAEFLGESSSGYVKFNYNYLELKEFPIEIMGGYRKSEQRVKCVAHPDTPDDIQHKIFWKNPRKLY